MVPSRRILRTLVATLAFLFFVAPALADQVTPSERVKTRLRAKDQPGPEGNVVGYLKPGEKADLLRTTGAWREVKAATWTGYVPSGYTTVIPDEPTPAPTAATVQPKPATQPTTSKIPAGDSIVGSVHVTLGIPLDNDPSDDYLLNRQYWVASYNPKRLVPNWVAWRLVPSDLGNQARSNSFAPDKNLPSTITIVQPKDYAKSGYDKGHMCPSADRTSALPANTETFLMTNMQPQLHSLNAGPWKSLETYERGLAASGKQVEIVAGGVFTNSTATIGPGIAVPTANFKILVVQEPGQTASDVTTSTPVYAVIMPNKAESAGTKWTQFLVSVDEVERQTGYDFLSEIPDDVENVIEARVANAPE